VELTLREVELALRDFVDRNFVVLSAVFLCNRSTIVIAFNLVLPRLLSSILDLQRIRFRGRERRERRQDGGGLASRRFGLALQRLGLGR